MTIPMGDFVEVTRFVTRDGVEHKTPQQAMAHVLRQQLRDVLEKNAYSQRAWDSDEIIALMTQSRELVRDYFDAFEIAEKPTP